MDTDNTSDSSDEVIISISCDAGEDQTISTLGTTVTLNATISDADSDTVSYSWASSSTDIKLINSDTDTTTFNVTSDVRIGAYTFTLTVNDGKNTATDEVIVYIDYM